jgi:hypothetical protein
MASTSELINDRTIEQITKQLLEALSEGNTARAELLEMWLTELKNAK